MKMLYFIYLLLASLSFATSANAEDCIKIKDENSTLELKGLIGLNLFAAQPEYVDINKGDWYEYGYILELAKPICITGGDFDINQSKYIQLINGYEYGKILYKNQTVTIKIDNLFPPFTAHHHAAILGSIKELKDNNGNIIAKQNQAKDNRKIYNINKDITEEYGTPMPMIRAFYDALYYGRGDFAQQFLIPEKRNKGAYNINALSTYYTNMKTPILLQNLTKISNNQYKVIYNYTTTKTPCDGSAIVNIKQIKDRWFIENIKAIGC